MTARLVIFGFAASVAAAVSLPGPSRAGATACAPGMHQVTFAGQPAFTFCGSARAVVQFGSRTIRFSNGLCRRTSGAFTVNIGTLVPGLRSSRPPYLGITTHTAAPGTQLNAAVGFAWRGRSYALANQLVVLENGLRRGRFSGRVLGTTTRVTGSFTC